MSKVGRIFTMFICSLFVLGSAVVPSLAGLKDKLQSDEFEGSSLSKFWSIDNPKVGKFEVNGGKLKVVGGFNGNVWGNSDALIFYQEVSQQSFDISTNFLNDYSGASTVAGILVKSETTQDNQKRDGEWVTLKLWGRGADNGDNAVLQYQRRQNDAADLGYVGTFKFADGKNYQPKAGKISIAMRLKREGNTYETWFKPEGKGDWLPVGKVTNALKDPIKVGIYAGIADTKGKLTVNFENFLEASAPVTAVDPRNRLTTTWGHLKSE